MSPDWIVLTFGLVALGASAGALVFGPAGEGGPPADAATAAVPPPSQTSPASPARAGG
ncbi:MAG: hypothetical protein AAFP13_06515 [Pseudomonadota bacterium]